MPEPTLSELPELVIFGGSLNTSQFSAISATIFQANMITGDIWPRVHGQLWPSDHMTSSRPLIGQPPLPPPPSVEATRWRVYYQQGLPRLVEEQPRLHRLCAKLREELQKQGKYQVLVYTRFTPLPLITLSKLLIFKLRTSDNDGRVCEPLGMHGIIQYPAVGLYFRFLSLPCI